MKRTFLALPIEDDALSAVLDTHQKLKELITRQGVRFLTGERLHLILRFYGYLDDDKVDLLWGVIEQISIPSITADITQIDGFPTSQRPKIVCAKVESATTVSFVESVEALTNSLIQSEDKPFQPHITLARVNPGSKAVGHLIQPMAKTETPIFVGWNPQSLCLYQTQADGSNLVVREREI